MPSKPKPPRAGELTSRQDYKSKGPMASAEPVRKPMPQVSSNFKKGGKVRKGKMR